MTRKTTYKKIVALALAALVLLCLATRPEARASAWNLPWSQSAAGSTADTGAQIGNKKGIQGLEFLTAEDTEQLNVKHVLINLDLTGCISTAPEGAVGSVEVAGQTYYFTSELLRYTGPVRALNEKGITVTAVLLLSWPQDPALQQLVYPTARQPGHPYYGWNTREADAAQLLEALLGAVARTYSEPGCLIENWIVGNEVNCPNEYHYTGLTALEDNTAIYAEATAMLQGQLDAAGNIGAKVYLSLQHNWARDETGSGFAGRAYIDSFAAQMAARFPQVVWNIAYHPYAAVLDSTQIIDNRLWFNERTTASMDTLCVTAANLNVLTDYIRDTYGSQHRIILSEQGFDAIGSEHEQAAFYAYTYYAAERNDMVDAAIFRTYLDFAGEPQKWGLIGGTAAEYGAAAAQGSEALRSYIAQNKREAYDVFKYMDTDSHRQEIDWYLGFIGIGRWDEPITIDAKLEQGERDYPTVYGGMDYAAVYNLHYYAGRYPDVAAAYGGDAAAILEHFVLAGMAEGRQGSAEFDPEVYRDNYVDLRRSYGDDWPRYYRHYITYGKAEGRCAYYRSYVLPDVEPGPDFGR